MRRCWSIFQYILLASITALVAFFIGYIFRKVIAESKIANAEELAKKLISDAEKEAETRKKELLLEAKEEIHRLRSEFDRETRERRNELQKTERRLIQKEETLDKKLEALE